MLTGSTFAFTGGTAEAGFATFWGQGAVTRFDGREGELTLDGEVASVMMGADFSRDSVIAGSDGLALPGRGRLPLAERQAARLTRR